jgi:hypothetical protein
MQDPEQAVVILATPKFASWLEDDTFIAGLLGSLTQSNSNCETMRKASESQFEEVVRPLSQIDGGYSPSCFFFFFHIVLENTNHDPHLDTFTSEIITTFLNEGRLSLICT